VGSPVINDKAYVAVSAGWPVHIELAHILVPQFVVLGGLVSLHVLYFRHIVIDLKNMTC
jgi:hypothetical protein